MKFKTRLVITFLTIILLPLVLASTAFLCIGAYLSREQEEYGIRTQDYNILIDPTQASKSISDEIFFEVKEIPGLKFSRVLTFVNVPKAMPMSIPKTGAPTISRAGTSPTINVAAAAITMQTAIPADISFILFICLSFLCLCIFKSSRVSANYPMTNGR